MPNLARPSTISRYFRPQQLKNESSIVYEGLSDLSASHSELSEDDLEQSSTSHFALQSRISNDSEENLIPFTSRYSSRWARRRRWFSLPALTCGRWRRNSLRLGDDNYSSKNRSLCRKALRLLAIALMLLGLIQFLTIILGLLAGFFPEEFDSWRDDRPSDPKSHWPTDASADIVPVACHSHNDYWRRVPLRSALEYGCTGVEADVWLYDEELFVGHSTSSLTPARTLRSLYVNPLLEILEKQNPNTTFHPSLDLPRNGVFDTKPQQTLVLLIDFKTDGEVLWPVVSEQLEPLRQNKYLSYFNGSTVVEGPITIVVTGNAPFNKVVENPHYRDMFFDAPLDDMARLAPENYHDYHRPTPPTTERDALDVSDSPTIEEIGHSTNKGQGHSGSAPVNPAVYSPANSYYASVSFAKSIGYPLPFLRRSQRIKISQQIAGAHARGLKVRYWNTPAWPRGLRNYLWRVLVREGVDYLNVDDLRGATRDDWNRSKGGWIWTGRGPW